MSDIKLICGNWGTSSLRAFGVSDTGDIVTDIYTGAGIASARKETQETVWFDTVRPIATRAPAAPHLICGMAGSNLGWLETGYVATPTSMDSIADAIAWHTFHGTQVGIVPGLSSTGWAGQAERMRGEETELLGWITRTGQTDATLCLPGTHTKWATLKSGQISHFNTAMTGEVFAALTQASLLNPSAPQSHSITAFEAGARMGLSEQGGDVLHRLFAARSEALAGRIQSKHTNAFLSGLLIGRDVSGARAALDMEDRTIHLIGADTLSQRFAHVLTLAGIASRFYASERCVATGLAALAKAGGQI